MTKNHQKIRSRCLVHEFSFTDIFNDSNHGYRAAILKKNSCLRFIWLWLLFFYYEKVRRTMRTATVSYLLKTQLRNFLLWGRMRHKQFDTFKLFRTFKCMFIKILLLIMILVLHRFVILAPV